jgi:PqqD family protein of HPr-rel-A system
MTDGPARESRWRAGRVEQLVWAELGDDFVVYHRPSGKTHFLNSASAVLLREVLTRPKHASAAADELAAREGAVAESDFVAAVTASLEHLGHLGLIERADD